MQTVDRLIAGHIFGIAVFDHLENLNHPFGWRVDVQGLINSTVSFSGRWSLKAR
jgi:hypothetical protein